MDNTAPATNPMRLAPLLNAPHPCRAVDRSTSSFHLFISFSLPSPLFSSLCFSCLHFRPSFLSRFFVSLSLIPSFLLSGCLSFESPPVYQTAPCSSSPQVSLSHPSSVNNIFPFIPSIYIYYYIIIYIYIFTLAPHCQSIYHLSNASNGIMSVIASSPDSAAVPYYNNPIPHCQQTHNFYRDPSVAVQPASPSSRTSSVSSFKSNYSVASTAPTTAYSPSSPTSSWRQCDSAASLDKILEPVFKRLPQEVYDTILNQLELLHTGSQQNGCLTCFQRDLNALSLTSRVWEKAVRAKLYVYPLGLTWPTKKELN